MFKFEIVLGVETWENEIVDLTQSNTKLNVQFGSQKLYRILFEISHPHSDEWTLDSGACYCAENLKQSEEKTDL